MSLLEVVATRRGTVTPTIGATTVDEYLLMVAVAAVDGEAVMEILLMVMAGLSGATGIMEAGHMTGLTGASGTQPGLLRRRLLPGLLGARGEVDGRDETGVDGGHGLLTYQNVTGLVTNVIALRRRVREAFIDWADGSTEPGRRRSSGPRMGAKDNSARVDGRSAYVSGKLGRLCQLRSETWRTRLHGCMASLKWIVLPTTTPQCWGPPADDQ